MAKQSASGGDASVPSWQCIHCQIQIHKLPEGFDSEKCPFCGKKQVLSDGSENNGQFLPPKQEREEENLFSESKKQEDRKKQNNRSQAAASSPRPSCNTRSKTYAAVATESHPLSDAEFIEINTTGIHPPPEKEFLVIFHVLIPLYAWDSKITASDVSLRFGHHTLGNWKSNIGEFKLVREVNQDLIEVECQLPMNYDILKSQRSVHYKYVVNTSSHKGEYEYLHGAPGSSSIKNRSFRVTTQEAEREGVYHQYDNMVFPEIKGRSLIKQTFTALKDFVTGSDLKKEELVVPNHETMQSFALEAYFEQYKAILFKCKISSSLNIEAATTKIMHIFDTLYLHQVSNEDEKLFLWKCEKLSEFFLGHLISIAKDLCQLEIKGAFQNGKRMSSVLVILCCLHHMIPKHIKMDQIHPRNISTLLNMLRLMPDPVQRQCLDWEYLMNMIPPTFKKTVYEAVLRFTVDLGHTEYLSKPQWLYSVPLVHLLHGAIQPFQELCLDPSKVPWEDRVIGLSTIRSKTYTNEYGIVEYMFSDLKPLTELDPSLLYCFVYICPRKELPQLFSYLLPFLSMAFSAKLLKNSRTYNREDIQEATKHLSFIAYFMRSHMETRFRLLTPTLDASLYLLTETMSKLGSNQEDYHLDFLRRSIELVLESVKFMKLFESNDRDTKMALNEQSAGALERLFYILNKYFKETVGKSFGMQQFINQEVEEVKIWNTIIPMEISCDEVKSMWENDVVAKIVKSRIDKVVLGKRFDIFCSLESIPNTHSIITNAILNAVMDEIKLNSTENIERLISSSTVQKRNVGKIINKILAERYPPNTESISFDELLDWDMWKTFIKIHKNEVMMSGGSVYGLSEQCAFLCVCAENTLDCVCTRIRTGEVTLEEISLLKKKKNHVEVLCAENEAKKADGEQLKKLLHQRFDELEEFRKRVVLLGQVCQSITVPVKGLDHLRAEIMKDTSKTPIKVLCVKKEENFSFLSLESATPLDNIKIKFDIILRNFSGLFSKIWNEHMKTAATAKWKSGSELTIPDIKTEIWEPAFTECQTLLDSLRERTIQLGAVNRYFKSVDQKKRMIQSLYAGIEKCMNNEVWDHDPHWITVAVDLVDKYWSLHEIVEVADVVLNLKGKLGLTGDFTLIETLVKQVTSSMPLSSIIDELIQAGKFLKDFTDNPAKLECLKMFANSMKIVDWIRNETTEVSNLHKFVSVALHTAAGEGDLTIDKLYHLKMIGNGFGPLIYDLKNDSSFETFKTSCKKVWKAIEQTPYLPRLLKDCNKEVEWFMSMKLTQGSVEVTSYGQMNNIFECGCYKIGTRKPIICKSHSKMISLLLKEREKPLTKRTYNVDELRDLESILVFITGSNAENRTLFLDTFHSVCRIAEVLIDLQKFGNVKYIGWILQVPCSADSEFQNEVVCHLQAQAREMETELSDWKEKVKQIRDRFYELNYYTTFQLLTLRRELGALKNSKETSVISPNVLALLQSISLDVTSDVVCDAVKQIITQEIEQSSVNTQEPMDTTSSHASGTIPLTDEIMKSADIHASTSSDVGRAGYTVQQNIEAVEKCDYIDSLAAKYDNEEELISQLSREDSHPQDDFKKDCRKSSEPISIHADSRAEERHLNLEQLGNVLTNLSEKLQGEVREQRPFPKQFLKDGYPNLLVLHPDLILKATLCLYMEDISYDLPLPTPEEILLCNPSTTKEEIELFWMRAVKDPMFKRIFCLVHAEKLSYQVSDWALRSLSDLTQGKQDYRLVIICSNEEEEKSHFISKLHQFRRHFVTQTDLQEYRRYLTMHFTSQMQIEESSISQYGTITSASAVDHESSRVRIVTSERSGVGKSLYIQQLAENLKMNLRLKECGNVHMTIPLHGPVVTPDTVLELFKDHVDRSTCCIYHIDIAPNVLSEVDTILFSLLILRGMSDSQGRVWRCHPNQLYAVEVTLPNRDHIPKRDKVFPESQTLSLLKLLPTVSCQSPQNAMQAEENKQRIDETVSQKQEELKRKPERSIQNGIPDTDPVLFHDSNEKEREITREDEGYVLSNDERLKEKYKFRENKQRIKETVSQKQEELKRRPERSYQNGISDTDPVPFHDSNKKESNKKEREVTREDEVHVLSRDERPKKFREKKQRIDETVSQKQEGLKRRPQRSIPDTDPVPFHNSNEKERVITREDEGHVLSHDERPKEKYKFRDHHHVAASMFMGKRIPWKYVLMIIFVGMILAAFLFIKLNPYVTTIVNPIQEEPLATPSTTLADPNKVKKLKEYPIIDKRDLFKATEEFGDWYGLCTYLKVDEAIMNQLEESTEKSTQKKRGCLTSYYNNRIPSWNEVVRAIADLKNKRLACKIAMEHMQWEEKDCKVELSM